jgi:hypothetical protein
MVKRIGFLAVVLALGLAVAAGAGQAAGKISGTVRDAQGQMLPNAKLQLRNIDTVQVVARTRSAADGGYEFTGVPQGNYLVEVVDEADKVLGLSTATALGPGAAVTGLMVSLSSTGALAGAAAAGGVGAFFTSTGGILLLVGIGAGVTAGVIAATNDASPSK